MTQPFIPFRRAGARFLASVLCAALVAPYAPLFSVPVAHAAPPDPNEAVLLPYAQWGVDGGVSETLTDTDGFTYMAGSFVEIGRHAPYFALVDGETAELVTVMPNVDGPITSVISDGDTGWYVAGRFYHMDGRPRVGLAHVLADGSVDEDFTAEFENVFDVPNFLQWETPRLALHPNGDVCVFGGGVELFVTGSDQPYLVCLDPEDGTPSEWDPQLNDMVEAVVFDGTGAMYVGGWFSEAGGVVRERLAKFDAAGEIVEGWFADVEGSSVNALAIRNDVVYLGGSFTEVNGEPRGNLAAVAVADGKETNWAPATDGPVYALTFIAGGEALIAGGSFTEVDETPQSNLALFEGVSVNLVEEFNLGVNDEVWSVASDDDYIYIAGAFSAFSAFDTEGRNGFASIAYDESVEIAEWDPVANKGNTGLPFGVLAAGEGNVMIFGDYTLLDVREQRGLMRLDPDGDLDEGFVPPAIWGTVNALALDETSGVLWVGGGFEQIGDEGNETSVGRLFAVDAETGAVLPRTPAEGADDDIYALALSSDGETLYVGGDFEEFNSDPAAPYLAAVNAETGALALTQPAPLSGGVRALAYDAEGRLYVGGWFWEVDSEERNGIARLLADGSLDMDWVPSDMPWSAEVHDIVVRPDRIYLADSNGITVLDAQTAGQHDISFRDPSVYTDGAFNFGGRAYALTEYDGLLYAVVTGMPFGGGELAGTFAVAWSATTGALADWFIPLGFGTSSGKVANIEAGPDGVDLASGSSNALWTLNGFGRFGFASEPPPPPSVVFTETQDGTVLVEGGDPIQVAVTLSEAPAEDVFVELWSFEGWFDPDPWELTFTPENWNEAQLITLYEWENTIPQGDVNDYMSYWTMSDDPRFNELLEEFAFTVQIIDDDLPSLGVDEPGAQLEAYRFYADHPSDSGPLAAQDTAAAAEIGNHIRLRVAASNPGTFDVFTTAGVVMLEGNVLDAVYEVTATVMDATDRYAYATLEGWGESVGSVSIVIRIDVDSFEIDDVLLLENMAWTSGLALDEAGGFLYVTEDLHRGIHKIDLSTFSVVDSLYFANGEDYEVDRVSAPAYHAATDALYAVGSCFDVPWTSCADDGTVLLQMATSPSLALVDALVIAPLGVDISYAIAEQEDAAYLAYSGHVARVDLDAFTLTATEEVPDLYQAHQAVIHPAEDRLVIGGLVEEEEFVHRPSVWSVGIPGLSSLDAYVFADQESWVPMGISPDWNQGFLYVHTNQSPFEILYRMDADTLDVTDTITMPIRDAQKGSVDVLGGYLLLLGQDVSTDQWAMARVSTLPRVQYGLSYAIPETSCAAVPVEDRVPVALFGTDEADEADWIYTQSFWTIHGWPTTKLLEWDVDSFRAGYHVSGDDSSDLPPIPLAANEGTEIEFTLQTSGGISEDDYCFFLHDVQNENAVFTHAAYPLLTISGEGEPTPEPGVTIVESDGSTAVTEGGAGDSYTIVLDSEPTASVVITISGDAQVQVSPPEVTFTTENWDEPRTITVTAVNDSAVEGNHTGTITHVALSADQDYDGITIEDVVVQITDNDVPSGGGGGGGGGGWFGPASIEVIAPPAGAQVPAGSNAAISWSTQGYAPFVNLSWSADDGATWQEIARNLAPTSGTYGWQVPVPGATLPWVRVRAEISDGAGVSATAVSAPFSIVVSVLPPEGPGGTEGPGGLRPGDIFKTSDLSTVYLLDANGLRHPFPNLSIFRTYFNDFDALKTVAVEDVAAYPLGAPVMPKPGTVLVKIQSDPKTYAVFPPQGEDLRPVLRWIPTEGDATALYGPAWADYVIDIEPTFFARFAFGEPLLEAEAFLVDRSALQTRAWLARP